MRLSLRQGTAIASVIATLGLAPAAAGLAQLAYVPPSADFLAGTWCFGDGIRARYALPSPGRLRVTRLNADRAAQLGEVFDFIIVDFGGGRFQLRPLKGNLSARFFARIDTEASFTYLEFTIYDDEQRRTVTRPLNQTAKRCGAETSSGGQSFRTRSSIG